jgi:hypothetical protein
MLTSAHLCKRNTGRKQKKLMRCFPTGSGYTGETGRGQGGGETALWTHGPAEHFSQCDDHSHVLEARR